MRPWLPDSGATIAADDDWAGRGEQPSTIAECPGRALPRRPRGPRVGVRRVAGPEMGGGAAARRRSV